MKPATGSVQSLERAFLILETLSRHPKGIGVVDLSNLVGLHKSTTGFFPPCWNWDMSLRIAFPATTG